MNYSNLNSKLPLSVMSEIADTIEKFKINNPLRLSHFLSQCSHETGGFKVFSENLNYSAKGLRGTFPKYFPTDTIALQYERKPEKIANRVYASRMGNGDEASGDGWKYRGRGCLQLTGKDNYKAFSTFIGEDCVANPDLILTKYSLASAGFFFDRNKLWDICDKGDSKEIVTMLTKRVNGGTHGLEDRIAKFELYKSLML